MKALRKVHAASGLDQSKIPFSQRKPVFSVRFLVIGVHYHNRKYLEGETEKVLMEDLGGEELWKVEDLLIPVNNTEDGVCYESLRLRKKDSFIHPGSAKKLRPHNGFIEHRVNYFTDSCDKRDKTPDGLRHE